MNFKQARVSGVAAIAAVLLAMPLSMGASPAGAAKAKCTVKGTNGSDRLFGTKGRDVICGLGGDDRIWGRTGNDVILGGKGDDVIRAGKGNDRLLGQPDDDSLYAGPGNDYLDGGRGRNYLYSGPGHNRCLNSETDTVTPGCDSEAPKLREFSVLDPEINTENEAAWVRLTFRVTDDLSGLRREPSLSITHPGSSQRQWATVEKTAGDRMDSTYSARVLMPHYAAQGRWEVGISFTDRQGNDDWLDGATLADLGFANGFDQTGLGDSEAPEIQSVSVNRTSADTSGAAQNFTFSIRVTDDMSGVPIEWFNAVDVSARFMDNGNQQFSAGNFVRLSGTDLDGIYQGTLTLPRYTRQGTLSLWLQGIDRAGNGNGLMPSDLANRGFPSQINQTGVGDTEAPKVLTFSVTPDQIDTTTESAIVTVRMRVTDNLAGVGEYGVSTNALPSNGDGFGEFIPRISGNELDGIYEGTIEIPDGTANGPIRFVPSAYDQASNGTNYFWDKLDDLGFDHIVNNGPVP